MGIRVAYMDDVDNVDNGCVILYALGIYSRREAPIYQTPLKQHDRLLKTQRNEEKQTSIGENTEEEGG